MALDSAFLDELRARTPIVPLIGRRVKLARSGRNWKGCCPFHGEKTPSFYVYDDHFHCFGCGAHGDAISFVMQSEGKGFPEAVEELASAAGLEVPKPDPRAREQAARARSLGDVLEAAQRVFARDLYEAGGRAGLDYLRRRGLTDATIASFGLGWASERRGYLTETLKEQAITPEMMAEAGLMRVDENGRAKGELFWGRVTFPIHDRRGELVSFGGRTLGDGQPKYLNGPETALFSKRRLLFGFDRARAALRAVRPKNAPPVEPVVVEGYMDVIALHQAGFVGAVAPLGTALTPEQMEMLWQVTPAPILCLDGDAAGRRAAVRAAETALPLLSAERGLRLCLLPEGEDPDSLLRGKGRDAMADVLVGAKPLADILFDLLSEGVPASPTPEQRATLRHRLVEAAGKIPDKALAGEYRSTLLDRFFKTYRSGGRPAGGRRRENGKTFVPAVDVDLGTRAECPFDGRRAGLQKLADIVMRFPAIASRVGDAWCRLDLPPDLSELREAILSFAEEADDTPESDLAARLMARLTEEGLRERAEVVLREACNTRPRGDEAVFGDEAPEAQWWHFYAGVNRDGFEADIARDTEIWVAQGMDPQAWDRLKSRIEALHALRSMDVGSI
ncbi:DNA primase [Acetobacter estunensis]|uniref:DNA primase n=1 Tax=Acetobacter estunensis TaxID=104097 RepID=UPI001C2CCCE8|nr:DNA primase [Acetobacter estunensis]MBV1837674.1 DNA primase [Acetobacter estunensis]